MVRIFRHFWFALLLSPALPCGAARIACGEEAKRPTFSPAVRQVLAWFPEDTETIVAASSFRMQAVKTFEPGKSDFTEFAQKLAWGELGTLDNGSYLKPLIGKRVAAALRGGRYFEGVSAFGSHRSEGCAVVVFEEGLGEAGKEWTDLLRQGAKEVRIVRGREVFVFPTTVVMERVFKLKPWQGTYLVLLTPDTLLCATSDVYLEEVLKRVGTQPADRALPDSLAEWRHIDPSAPAWMIRHIPRANEKRIIDGVTWSMKKDQVVIEYLPLANAKDEVETQARSRWASTDVVMKSEFRRSENGTVIVTLNVNMDPATSFLAMLFLNALQNESGAVGAQ